MLHWALTAAAAPTAASPVPGRYGTSKGIPDLLVWRVGWHGFVGLEVKTPTGRVRPEQRALADAGALVIVRSLDDALAAVGAMP
jgi:hypothetical protein